MLEFYEWFTGIQIQSPTTAAGASSHNSYPIAQILTVNLKVTAGHPGSRAKSLEVFSGAAACIHVVCMGGDAPTTAL